MNKRGISILLAAFFVVSAAIVGSGRVLNAEIPAPPAIGSTIDEFTLPDVDGTDRTLKAIKGAKGTVLIFIAVQCPVSNAYNERMEKLAQDYQAKGINVIGVNANATEDATAVKNHAAAKHLTFMILKDPNNKLADKLGAANTPEAYVLDANNRFSITVASTIVRIPGVSSQTICGRRSIRCWRVNRLRNQKQRRLAVPSNVPNR